MEHPENFILDDRCSDLDMNRIFLIENLERYHNTSQYRALNCYHCSSSSLPTHNLYRSSSHSVHQAFVL
jgi:hypothetical protein